MKKSPVSKGKKTKKYVPCQECETPVLCDGGVNPENGGYVICWRCTMSNIEEATNVADKDKEKADCKREVKRSNN